MFSKINILRIIKDHFGTLYDQSRNTVAKSDYFLFLVLPVIVAAVLYGFDVSLSESLINILITALSIFVGLLLNLLVIIFDIITKTKEDDEARQDELKRQFLKEIYANISFSILISIVSISLLILTLMMPIHLRYVSNFLSICFILLFALTLLMILKRVHVLLSNEFKK